MTDVSRAIQKIEEVANELGVAELARRANVPYTTLATWRQMGWKPKWLIVFDRLEKAAASATTEKRSSKSRKAA